MEHIFDKKFLDEQGLKYCTVCKQAEIELTKECPGKLSSQLKPPVMHAYNFELYGHSGKIDAENMQQALYKVIDFYFKLPYPSQEHVRIDIKCKRA